MIPPDHLLNPSNVDPSLELPHPFQGAPNWSEYHYLFAYDPAQNFGVSIHIGRLLGDLGLWRGILYVFPPEGDVLVHRCVGRDGHELGPGAGPFKASCLEPFKRWLLEFDGAMHRASETDLANGPLRDEVDEIVKFRIELEAAAPLYSLEKKHAKTGPSWPHHHHEQLHTIRGEATFGGKTLQLTGVGARDHSSGGRDYTQMLGAFWMQLVFPSGRCAHVTIVRRQGTDMSKLYVANSQGGYIWWNDGSPLELVEMLEGPPVVTDETPLRSVARDITTDPARRRFTVVLQSSKGLQTLEVERIRGTYTTYIPPCDEIAGTDLARTNSLQQGKSLLSVTWDGEVGYGMTDNMTAIKFLEI